MFEVNLNRLLKIVLIITLASVLTLGFAMAGCSSNSSAPTQGTNTTSPTEGAEVGNLAPDFQFQDRDEKLVSLSDFQGRPVILNFWATSCYYCIYEMPYLQQVYEEWSSEGLVLLAINMGGTPSRVEEFLKSHNLSLPVLLDTKNDVGRRYNVLYIPTTFFIDKNGIIQAVRVGAFLDKKAIEDNLNKIMP
jgi:peroxiredoxin